MRNYSLGDTFKVALECDLKTIASERQHVKRNAALTNQVEVVQPQALLQSEEISEVHMCNPNYKGKNYDPNFQAKRAEAHTQLLTTASSLNNHLQWLTNTKPLTTNQPPRIAPATATHH